MLKCSWHSRIHCCMVGSWNQSSHCRFFPHANVWEACQPVNEHGHNEGKPWRGPGKKKCCWPIWFFIMFHFLSSTVTLYTRDWCYSRVLLAFQINCRFGVGFGRACSQHTNVTDITACWMMHVRRGSTRGVIFLAIFSGHKQYLNIKQYIKQYQAMQFNAISRDFAKAIIAQKSLALSLGPAGCLEATDRQHVRFRQGERCERRWGPIVPNEAVPVEEDGSSSGSCYLDWHGLADYVTIMFYIILLYIISTFFPHRSSIHQKWGSY